MIRVSLKDAKLPDKLWAEAANKAVFIKNRTYKKSIDMTPYESFMGKRPNLNHLHPFGTKVRVKVENVNKVNKLKYDNDVKILPQ